MRPCDKDEKDKLPIIRKIRFSRQMDEDLDLKRRELKMKDFSPVVRKACTEFLYRNLNEQTLLYASINDLKQRMNRLEGMIQMLCVMQMEQTKKMIRYLPLNRYVDDDVVESEYEKFEFDCGEELKKNHGGKIEAMVLDIYKKEAAQEDDAEGGYT